MRLVGGRPSRPIGEQPLPGRSHYFVGRDPAGWHAGVPSFGRVRYPAVYPGVDLTYHHDGAGELEYDLTFAPGVDPAQARIAFEGARRLRLDPDGGLVIESEGVRLTQRRPVAYQEIGGGRRPVEAELRRVDDRTVSFRLGAYDRSRPVVVDPTFVYSTYLGGGASDSIAGIAVDKTGNVYLAGGTSSTDYPIVSAYQPSNKGGKDAFVSKLSADGQTLVYSTYIGGMSGTVVGCGFGCDVVDHPDDAGSGIAVDGDGNAYITGTSHSTDFPTTATAYQKGSHGWEQDGFVAKVSADGSQLLYSTYLGVSIYTGQYACTGGCDDDQFTAIAIDAFGNAYVTGSVPTGPDNSNPTTAGAYQRKPGGMDDAFVAKLNADASLLSFYTYLGGGGVDQGRAIALDASNNVYVTGVTSSADFPVAGAAQATAKGGQEAFVAKLTADGTTLTYATYFGGSGDDNGQGIAVAHDGSAVVAGVTHSADLAVVGATQAKLGGGADAFLARLSPAGSVVTFATFLGGSQDDLAWGVALDGAGAAYLAGQTGSGDFPQVQPIQKGSAPAGLNAFIAKIDLAAPAVAYASWFGGGADDVASQVAVDPMGTAYVGGTTRSGDFPTRNPEQAMLRGDSDGFAVKLVPDTADLSVKKTANAASIRPGEELTYTITVANAGPGTAHDTVLTDVLPAGETLISAAASQGACTGTATVTCTLGEISNAANAMVIIMADTARASGSALHNLASVKTSSTDPVPDNDTASVDTALEGPDASAEAAAEVGLEAADAAPDRSPVIDGSVVNHDAPGEVPGGKENKKGCSCSVEAPSSGAGVGLLLALLWGAAARRRKGRSARTPLLDLPDRRRNVTGAGGTPASPPTRTGGPG